MKYYINSVLLLYKTKDFLDKSEKCLNACLSSKKVSQKFILKVSDILISNNLNIETRTT